MSTLQQLDVADSVRLEVAPRISHRRKSELGQFMTPSRVARFMADMFPPSTQPTCRLLDAGAGVGALSCAFLDRWLAGGFGFATVEATAYEIDPTLREHLVRHLSSYANVKTEIVAGDYIELATSHGLDAARYTHAILNPPYKKINSDSAHRHSLRSVGIETVNLYSAFLALAIAQTIPGGQIVAIVPRSFCNGPYHRPFRSYILERVSICHIHLFESRNKAFKDDGVLQENVILRLERSGKQGPVMVTTSTDDTFDDIVVQEYPFDRIVLPDDQERFIHVPTSPVESPIASSPRILSTLQDVGIKVSTGPVVDFRLKEFLRSQPDSESAPLIYPGHLALNKVVWPIPESKKPNAILRNEATERWLYPNGFYCIVRRFSSKEERRRVVAAVIDPATFHKFDVLGFENHLNVFHEDKHGMPELLARGLACYLNTTAVDEDFRRFSGNTQVNATDLRAMTYPNRQTLVRLGYLAKQCDQLSQEMIDEQFGRLIA